MGASQQEWELEEGIPQKDDPFIQQYLRGRASLIVEEQKQRHDFTLHKALSPIAATACKIVSKIRARDLKLPSEQVEKSDLWRILRRMPKGSLLHAHLHTLVDVDFLVNLAFSTPGICIAAPAAFVVESDYDSAPFYFRYSSHSDQGTDEPTLWEPSYRPSTLIPLQQAASKFPNGGEPCFREWLQARCLARSECLPHGNNADRTVNSLLTYEPILRASLRHIYGHLAIDAVKYIEIRHSFDLPFQREANNEPAEDSFMDWCRVFQDEVNSFKATDDGHSFHGARVIWTSNRLSFSRYVFDDMVQCILAKTEFPDVICGFDVMGQDSDRPLTDLVPILFWFRRQCMEEGVDIPFLFHAGDYQSDTGQVESNAFDAILLGSRRIGHGLSLYKHPLLIDLAKEKKILLECCPESGGQAMQADSSSSSLPALLSRGASVALCHDSAAASKRNTGIVTSRFWKTLVTSGDMGLTDLAMMAENSVRWSCLADQPSSEWLSDIRQGILGEGMKAIRLREWYSEFERFCEWIALEFAEEDIDD
ncbi:hypothetical protein BDV59DRAFT_179576 [Aspergillus ambiguus]|uniref:putative CECR1 family adenosine deaminase n=1 Tax=Aspergillus ambiguus TaxID=176160 RepID=UPI003CCD0C2D